jgi:hypothetical protein
MPTQPVKNARPVVAENPHKRWYKSPEIWTAVGTVALAIFGIPSFIFLYLQLRESHNALMVDQRAWIAVEPSSPKSFHKATGFYDSDLNIKVGEPLFVPMRVSNTGKTAAKNLDVKLFAGIIDADKEPPLDRVEDTHPTAFTHIVTGTLSPSDGIQHDIPRFFKDGNHPEPLSAEEFKALEEGRAYIAVYGIATYDDIFGTHRWTKFCGWIPTVKGAFEAKECTKFNDVDSN